MLGLVAPETDALIKRMRIRTGGIGTNENPAQPPMNGPFLRRRDQRLADTATSRFCSNDQADDFRSGIIMQKQAVLRRDPTEQTCPSHPRRRR